MSYLLDTNVLSELVRTRPNQQVLKWFETINDNDLYISVLTLGEIRQGVEKIREELRKEKIRLWLEADLLKWLAERILPIDEKIADRWGRLVSEMNRPLPVVDSLLAATALHYDLRIVTRNEQDFQYPSLLVVNPWKH